MNENLPALHGTGCADARAYRDQCDALQLQLDQARTRVAALESLRQLAGGQWSALGVLPRQLREALGVEVRATATKHDGRNAVHLWLYVR